MTRRSLALFACLALALAPAPAFAAAEGATGIDFSNRAYNVKSTSRLGSAEFTKAELTEAMDELPKDQKIAIRQIMGKLDKVTQKQLNALIAKHRVSYKDATGHTLIDNLWALCDKELNHGIENGDLIREIIRDVARPATIAQAAHGTCSVTSIQSALARSAPGEYARIIAGLASGDGVVTCRDGKTKLSGELYIAYDDRTCTGNLFQPAGMDRLARYSGYRYDNKKDENYKKGAESYSGAGATDYVKLQTALLVGKYENVVMEASTKARVTKILKNASAKHPVVVSMMTPEGGHAVQLVGYDEAKKAYKVRNPWGETVEVPKKLVDQNLNSVNHRVDED